MIRVFIFALLFALILPAPAAALRIAPFKLVLQADSAAGQIIRIENNTDEPAAVQVSVTTWEIMPDGTEVNNDAENDFVVFPAQLVLAPRENKAVRVQWLGVLQGDVGAERPYRLVAEQLPVVLRDTPQPGIAVRFLLRFKAALYVRRGTVRSDIRVDGLSVEGNRLKVTLRNHGTGHAVLRDPALRLTLSEAESLTLNANKLGGLAGQNLHAGIVRHFTVDLPAGISPEKVIAATLEYRSGF